MWIHVNNCRKGAVACLYQEGGITGIMFYHQLGELISWRAYNRDFTVALSKTEPHTRDIAPLNLTLQRFSLVRK